MVTETSKFGNAKTREPLQIEQFQTPRLKDNRLACALGYVRNFSDDVIITWWRHQVGHHFSRFLRNLHYFKLKLCPEGVINSEIRLYYELDNRLRILELHWKFTIGCSFIKIIAVEVGVVSKAWFWKVENWVSLKLQSYEVLWAVTLNFTLYWSKLCIRIVLKSKYYTWTA